MDLTQIIIALSILSITTIIVISGIYFIKILKELRLTISTTNSILSDARSITSSVSKPVSSFSEFLMGFKNGFSLFNSFFNKDQKDKKE